MQVENTLFQLPADFLASRSKAFEVLVRASSLTGVGSTIEKPAALPAVSLKDFLPFLDYLFPGLYVDPDHPIEM